MLPQGSEEIEDIDIEDLERELQAKIDFAAKIALEKALIKMVKAKKSEIKEMERVKRE